MSFIIKLTYMEQSIKQLKRSLATIPLLVSPLFMNAQVKDIGSVLSQWNSYIKAGSEQIFLFVSIICVLIGVFQLIIVFPKFSSGDQHSAAAFLKHGGGLILVIVMLNLFRILI